MWSPEDSNEVRKTEVTCEQIKVKQQMYSEDFW